MAQGTAGLADRYRELVEELARLEDDLAARFRLYSVLALDEEGEIRDPEHPELPGRVTDWDKAAVQDRRENVLYQLWMQARLTQGPVDLELEEFSEVVAGRALVRLLYYVPHGERLLASLAPKEEPSWVPDKSKVRAFVLSGGLAEANPERFLSRLFAEVPGSRRALYRILGAYKAAVQLEADRFQDLYPGILPGEDYGPPPVTWDQLARLLGVAPLAFEVQLAQARALERAVREYLRGKSLVQAAQESRVARERLRAVLRERGLLRTPGRPKKGAV
jgi:hypothetical protein